MNCYINVLLLTKTNDLKIDNMSHNGKLNIHSAQLQFDNNDPRILNAHIWTYNPIHKYRYFTLDLIDFIFYYVKTSIFS